MSSAGYLPDDDPTPIAGTPYVRWRRFAQECPRCRHVYFVTVKLVHRAIPLPANQRDVGTRIDGAWRRPGDPWPVTPRPPLR